MSRAHPIPEGRAFRPHITLGRIRRRIGPPPTRDGVPLDVGMRRIHIDFTRVREWLGGGKRKRGTTQTMDALLRRKENVRTTLDARPQGETQPADFRQSESPTSVKPQPLQHPASRAEEPDSPEETADEELSTTERLLKMKRKKK
ncbi:MAG: hypothetical protein MI757_09075 [Pirellulales bacterium]|nr:hypothetical protein [Pirellulales bacterium]